MPWVIAFIVIAVLTAGGVSGVGHPLLYGIFIASVLVIPLWLAWTIGGGIIDSLFGRRK